MAKRECINEIVSAVRKHNLSQKEFRYAIKRVREITGLHIAKGPRREPTFYTPDEVRAILEAATRCSLKHRVLAECLIRTGLRIGEARALDLRDLEPEGERLLHVRHRKGGKDRVVPLSRDLYEEIRLHAGERRAGPVFGSVTIRTMQRWYDQAVRAAGIEGKGTPHTARHTCAAILRAQGCSLEDLQRMMGHSFRDSTEIYAKLTFTREVRDRYLQLFEGGAYKQ